MRHSSTNSETQMAATSDQRPRIEDYLNDRLQSQADLDGLENLLESVKRQQESLRQQLQEARLAQDESQRATSAYGQGAREKTEGFVKKQHDVDRRMQALMQSDVSDDAIQRFDAIMRKLQRVSLAGSYIETFEEIEQLARNAATTFTTDARAGIASYTELQQIASALASARAATDEAAPHLIHYTNVRIGGLRRLMWDTLAGKMNACLAKIGWPTRNVRMDFATEQEWTRSINLLLELQAPELVNRKEGSDPKVLLPFEVMVKPLELRFKYHFEGERPTNRLDKPEYFLTHVAELLNDYDEFFVSHLQPLLRNQFRNTDLALDATYIDATTALVTALLPMLRAKLKTTMPKVASTPASLVHIIHELMVFDTTLRDNWQYRIDHDVWRGLTGEILEEGYFVRWLEVERDFALERYGHIIEAADAGEIDYESVDTRTTKPTNAAMRVSDLLEGVTERYRPLVLLKHKLRLALDVQVEIVDRYYRRLVDAMNLFIAISNPISRKVHGYTREQIIDVQGLKGLDTLCRIYGSTDYLLQKMSDWNDDIVFLELWDEIQGESHHESQPITTEAAIDTSGQDVMEYGAFFDEISGNYASLRARVEGLIQDHAFGFVQGSLTSYNRVSRWSTEDQGSTITAELTGPLQSLRQCLELTQHCLAQSCLRRIWRGVLHQLQTWLWDHIIFTNNFSRQGSIQLRKDVQIIFETVDVYCGKSFGESSMGRIREATELLNFSRGAGDSFTSELLNFQQRLFVSDEEARSVLKDIGCENLEVSDARLVISKRIDLTIDTEPSDTWS